MNSSALVANRPVVRPGILEIEPYVGGESAIPGVDRIIKLASNEGALGPSPKAMAALKEHAASMHRYPDGATHELREALAKHWSLEADRIVCGAGSDELIQFLVRAYVGPGDDIVQSRHGFLMYGIAARSVGARAVFAPEADLTADVDALLAAVTPRTKLLFLANPNNPTGTYIPAGEVARLRANLPAHIVLVIDAAYAEFVSSNDYEPGIDLVRSGDNVVMLRTFSKIYALGGLRLGWAYCPPSIADVLNRLRGPFNVSSAAQSAGVVALADQSFFVACQRHNELWLGWLTHALRELGIEVVPSVCNFVLARFGSAEAANTADRLLRARGVIVRAMRGYGLPDSLRITVGTEAEMHMTVAALEGWQSAVSRES